MSRTNIDLDDAACRAVMERYHLTSKRDAVNLALRPRPDENQPARMILIGTSSWIEFLRDTGSTVCTTVHDLLAADIAICDAISMEVLATHTDGYGTSGQEVRTLPGRSDYLVERSEFGPSGQAARLMRRSLNTAAISRWPPSCSMIERSMFTDRPISPVSIWETADWVRPTSWASSVWVSPSARRSSPNWSS